MKSLVLFSKLRCTFGDRSIVPAISVFYWARIPTTSEGDIANQFNSFPDWIIKILSPNQKSTKVIDNIVYCLEHGSRLGWLIDCKERAIFIFQSQQTPAVYRNNQQLPILKEINLELTPDDIFAWLKIRRSPQI